MIDLCVFRTFPRSLRASETKFCFLRSLVSSWQLQYDVVLTDNSLVFENHSQNICLVACICSAWRTAFDLAETSWKWEGCFHNWRRQSYSDCFFLDWDKDSNSFLKKGMTSFVKCGGQKHFYCFHLKCSALSFVATSLNLLSTTTDYFCGWLLKIGSVHAQIALLFETVYLWSQSSFAFLSASL